jgi:flagellar basal-body rod protein FlgB
MPISDFPILSMLRTRMQWHQERQRVLAENVANAETPNYRARDLAPPDFENLLQRTGSLAMARTDPGTSRRSAAARNSPTTRAATTKSVRAAPRLPTKRK